MTVKSAEEYADRAIAMWNSFSNNARRLVAIGVFPAEAMTAAEKDGFHSSTLAVALMRLQRTNDRPRFRLGRIVATPGALDLFKRAKTNEHSFLARHVHGDWGELSEEDKRANDASLINGARILSAYVVGEEKVWVITEADRSSTCLLLPSEY